MKIAKLCIGNYKGVASLECEIGDVTTVSGPNGAGKSSVLDALCAALGDVPAKQPVRQGADEARIVVTLSDGTEIRRRITEDGKTALSVVHPTMGTVGKGRAFVDGLIGDGLALDPEAFARLPDKEQAAKLRQLVGVDTTAADAEIKALRDERTHLGRVGKDAAGYAAGLPSHPDAPAEPVSIADLSARMAAVDAAHGERAKLEREADDAAFAASRCEQQSRGAQSQADSLERQIADLQRLLAEAREDVTRHAADAVTHRQREADTRAKAAAVVVPDRADLQRQLADVEQTNAKVAANRAKAEAEAKADKLRQEYAALSDRIDAAEAAKAQLVASAKWPVEGLGMADGVVTYRGVPLADCSAAEKLRVSTGIALGLQGELRLVAIRDASLLDRTSLQMVRDMCAAANAQLLLEIVQETDGGELVITEG
jgi:energy-coupling factor transporter ATP-binding protein EcfA2